MPVKISKIHQRLHASAARQKTIEENRFWDELHDTHDLCEARALAMLNQVHGLTEAFSNPENKIAGFIQKPNELSVHIKTYLADIQMHLDKLASIYEMHKDRRGIFNVELMNDEVRLHLTCADQYKEASDVYDSVITPSLNQIIEIFAAAELLMGERGLALSPNAPTSKPPEALPPVEIHPVIADL